MGETASQFTFSASDDSAAPGPRGLSVGVPTAGGVPADCMVTAGPNGPAPSELVARTATLCSWLLVRPDTVAFRPGAATLTCLTSPVAVSVTRTV